MEYTANLKVDLTEVKVIRALIEVEMSNNGCIILMGRFEK